MDVVFFNQPWRERQLQDGLKVALFGKADTYRGGLQMTNPIVDLIGDRTGRIVAIYPQSEKAQLTTWEIAGWVEDALGGATSAASPTRFPTTCVAARPGRPQEALFGIHLPETMGEKEAARRRLAFDELLRVQIVLVHAQAGAASGRPRGIRHQTEGELVGRFHELLPFPLTAAQRRTIDEIQADLAGPHPMHRLLQGDVGAGKTVVAVSALLTAVQGGHQGALMAPTEVLAEQHAAGVRRLLDGLTVPDPANLFGDRPLRVELLTNRVTGSDRSEILGGIERRLRRHRHRHPRPHPGGRAVQQPRRRRDRRAAPLRRRAAGRAPREVGEDGTAPDVLVMTATPIPRTAAMTVYGDLDVSVLDELPPGPHADPHAWANGPLLEAAVWADVRDEVADGPAGVRGVPVDRGEREARGGVGRGDVSSGSSTAS